MCCEVSECKKLKYTSTNLLICFHDCEAWSLTLREKHCLKLFEKKKLRTIFELNWDDAAGIWRELYNEELLNLYSFPDVIRLIESRRVRWPAKVRSTKEEKCLQRSDRKTWRKELTRKN
jgi:hypothetical protein